MPLAIESRHDLGQNTIPQYTTCLTPATIESRTVRRWIARRAASVMTVHRTPDAASRNYRLRRRSVRTLRWITGKPRHSTRVSCYVHVQGRCWVIEHMGKADFGWVCNPDGGVAPLGRPKGLLHPSAARGVSSSVAAPGDQLLPCLRPEDAPWTCGTCAHALPGDLVGCRMDDSGSETECDDVPPEISQSALRLLLCPDELGCDGMKWARPEEKIRLQLRGKLLAIASDVDPRTNDSIIRLPGVREDEALVNLPVLVAVYKDLQQGFGWRGNEPWGLCCSPTLPRGSRRRRHTSLSTKRQTPAKVSM
ncbi:MAG: hypothetical protein MHM6MM_003650 [Cercozoa sp. M6MM]